MFLRLLKSRGGKKKGHFLPGTPQRSQLSGQGAVAPFLLPWITPSKAEPLLRKRWRLGWEKSQVCRTPWGDGDFGQRGPGSAPPGQQNTIFRGQNLC